MSWVYFIGHNATTNANTKNATPLARLIESIVSQYHNTPIKLTRPNANKINLAIKVNMLFIAFAVILFLRGFIS